MCLGIVLSKLFSLPSISLFFFTESAGYTYFGQPYGDEVKPCKYNCLHMEKGGANEILRL